MHYSKELAHGPLNLDTNPQILNSPSPWAERQHETVTQAFRHQRKPMRQASWPMIGRRTSFFRSCSIDSQAVRMAIGLGQWPCAVISFRAPSCASGEYTQRKQANKNTVGNSPKPLPCRQKS